MTLNGFSHDLLTRRSASVAKPQHLECPESKDNKSTNPDLSTKLIQESSNKRISDTINSNYASFGRLIFPKLDPKLFIKFSKFSVFSFSMESSLGQDIGAGAISGLFTKKRSQG